MKNAVTIILVALCFAACKKDYEKVQIQKHDKNDAMKIMHTMMSEMNMMTLTKDPDQDFAMMMKMHHQGAINMAQYELDKGGDAEMRSTAQKVKDAQQAEISQLESFMATHTPDTISQQFVDKIMTSMTKMDQASDLQVIIGKADYDFASLMVVHHQSAVEMAQAELDHGKHQAMKDMAQMIIDMQKKEIADLQNWLLRHKEY